MSSICFLASLFISRVAYPLVGLASSTSVLRMLRSAVSRKRRAPAENQPARGRKDLKEGMTCSHS
eukprot:6474448-Amphidinium_carterae.5